MNLIVSNLISVGAFSLVIFLSGFWLNRMGRPYGMLPVTVHKLIGLALGVYLGWMVYQTHKIIPLSTIQIIAVAVTVLFFAVNVATGPSVRSALGSESRPVQRSLPCVET